MTKLTTEVVHNPDPNVNIKPKRASDLLGRADLFGEPISCMPTARCRYSWRNQTFAIGWYWCIDNTNVQEILDRLNEIHKSFEFTFQLEISFAEATLWDPNDHNSDDIATLDEFYKFDSVEDFDLTHFLTHSYLPNGLVPVPKPAPDGGWGFVTAGHVCNPQIVELCFRSFGDEVMQDGTARMANPLEETIPLITSFGVTQPDLDDDLSGSAFFFGIADVYQDGSMRRMVPYRFRLINFRFWADPIIYYELAPPPFPRIPLFDPQNEYKTYAAAFQAQRRQFETEVSACQVHEVQPKDI